MQKKQQKEQKKPKQKKLLNTWKCFMVLRAVNWQLPFLHQFQRFQIRNLGRLFKRYLHKKEASRTLTILYENDSLQHWFVTWKDNVFSTWGPTMPTWSLLKNIQMTFNDFYWDTWIIQSCRVQIRDVFSIADPLT